MKRLKAEGAWARHGTRLNHAVVLYQLLDQEMIVINEHKPTDPAIKLVETILGGVVISVTECPF